MHIADRANNRRHQLRAEEPVLVRAYQRRRPVFGLVFNVQTMPSLVNPRFWTSHNFLAGLMGQVRI